MEAVSREFGRTRSIHMTYFHGIIVATSAIRRKWKANVKYYRKCV